MTQEEKVIQLKTIITESLNPIIGKKVILLDCPYHGNIGDLLIWQGELDYFKSTGRTIIRQHSLFTFDFPEIPKDVTICLHGGGNFGDLYRAAQDFRIKVIEQYPHNKIVILPQSIYYENKSLIHQDSILYSQHKDLLICARDESSYNFLRKYFSQCDVMLLPDMAFCLTIHGHPRKIIKEKHKILYFKRLDKEFIDNFNDEYDSYEQRDWYPFEKKNHYSFILMRIGYKSMVMEGTKLKWLIKKTLDFTFIKIIRKKLIKQGIKMLSEYDVVYTTRLHAMILGILLHKKVFAIDNLTKKLSDYYYTWLYDCDNVHMQ